MGENRTPRPEPSRRRLPTGISGLLALRDAGRQRAHALRRRRRRPTPSTPLELYPLLGLSLELASSIPLGDRSALVVHLLAAPDSQFELGATISDVEPQWDNCLALGLRPPDQ